MEPVFIKNLSNEMKKPLPGKSAQKEMMVTPQYKLIANKQIVPAAVLILLYPIKREWFFFLKKRTKTVEYHKGQISLPGGMVEENESLEDTAIRETFEEIGVNPKKIKIISNLTCFYVPVSGFEIFPFIGWSNKKPKTIIQSSEVSRIFSPSIKTLMLEKTKKEKYSIVSGYKVKIPFFELEGEMVWGATSVILSEFKSILKRII